MSSLHALLVTSDPTRRVLRPLLHAHGDVHIAAEVTTLPDARAVLAMLHVDVVFLQTSLEGEDGFELLPSIPDDIRVVALTSDGPDMMRALAIGSLECIPLPVRSNALAVVLERVRRGDAISPYAMLGFA